jgi:cell division protein ZipA
MDLSVRDWMIIIGVLLIVAVLLDGYRRMRSGSGKVKMSLAPAPEPQAGDGDIHVAGELPNGGARVIRRDDEEGEGEAREALGILAEPPLLTEEPLEPEPEPEPAAPAAENRRGENLDLLTDLDKEPEPPGRDGSSVQVDPEVFLLHVVARDPAGFAGEDILQILLAFELRFGEMNFFHGHQQAAGRGAIQFSVANMLQPGVFDIDAMTGFTTPGLIFFVNLPGPEDMMGAFDQMARAARGVAEHLGGDLLDESRSVATRQTLDHMRQRIHDLERRMLAQSNRQG